MTPRQIQHSCGSFVANGVVIEKDGGTAELDIFCNCTNIIPQRRGCYGTVLRQSWRLLNPGLGLGKSAGQARGRYWSDVSEIAGGVPPRYLQSDDALRGIPGIFAQNQYGARKGWISPSLSRQSRRDGRGIKTMDQMAWV